jgi:ferritin-like metal-binding protein YciE
LLKHEIFDLYSAEEQIIEALPAMIDKAKNTDLKNALQEHLKITEEQKKRLDQVQQLLNENNENEEVREQDEEKKGFFSRLFKGSNGKEKCMGMEGLIEEGQKIMREDISPEALDAAIIASAQKVEHYEISGYGTARAYAAELNLNEVQKLLEQTLNEEYEADDRLTALALKRVNLDAEKADMAGSKSRRRNIRSNERPQRGAASTKKPMPKEQKSSGQKKNANTNKSAASKKATANKSAASKRKSENSPLNQNNKKNVSKRPQKKSKKAASKRKEPAK